MTKIKMLAILGLLSFGACSPHFHLDFLGEETMEEVVLMDSPARAKVLILDISGIISSSINPGLFQREGHIVSRVYSRLLKASRDPDVKAVILRLDTPGGEVTASDIIYNEILRFKDRTGLPVIAMMMGVAASGGYYIASASDHILAHPSTITGSIGVISIFPNMEDLFDKIGMKINVVKSGEMKDSGSPFREMSEKEKAVFQGMIDEMYQSFLAVVHKGRRGAMDMDTLKKLADGRIYTARQAQRNGLVDEIGYFENALEKAEELAGISSAKVVSYTYYPKSKTNVYASTSKDSPRLGSPDLKDILPSLKSGFYYLWLPADIN